jgi:hypothetical protein
LDSPAESNHLGIYPRKLFKKKNSATKEKEERERETLPAP